MKRLILAALLLSTGCVSAETKQAATELVNQIDINEKTTDAKPGPGIDPVEWAKGQRHVRDLAIRVKQGVQ